jgi:hypothetical protein
LIIYKLEEKGEIAMLREGGREGERGKWIRLVVVGVGRLFLSFSESDVVGLVMWCIFVQVKDFSHKKNDDDE